MACLTAGCAAGATWLPADHPSTVAARQFVDELVAAAVSLVAEQQGSEAAELFKQTFGRRRIAVKVFQRAPRSRRCTLVGFAMELSVNVASGEPESTVAHEVSHIGMHVRNACADTNV